MTKFSALGKTKEDSLVLVTRNHAQSTQKLNNCADKIFKVKLKEIYWCYSQIITLFFFRVAVLKVYIFCDFCYRISLRLGKQRLRPAWTGYEKRHLDPNQNRRNFGNKKSCATGLQQLAYSGFNLG